MGGVDVVRLHKVYREKGIWIRGSPIAVESSAMDLRVRFGKPVVHLEMTASERPIFWASSL